MLVFLKMLGTYLMNDPLEQCYLETMSIVISCVAALLCHYLLLVITTVQINYKQSINLDSEQV